VARLEYFLPCYECFLVIDFFNHCAVKNKINSSFASLLIGLFLIQFLYSCKEKEPVGAEAGKRPFVSTLHLENLYQEVKMPNGTAVGSIAIYSNFPNYTWVADNDEGATCVDDVARAAMFYLNEPDLNTSTTKQDKLNKLVEFVLQMQAENGYFYNFLWGDHTINKTFQTSVAEANWWSWRAFWCLNECYGYYKNKDAAIAARIDKATNALLANIQRDILSKAKTTETISGVEIPKWLPAGSGADQSAILLLGLLSYYQRNNETVVLQGIEKLGEGILLMQKGEINSYPFRAFLSWQNTWHAYGSDAAYAMLKAGKALQKPTWVSAAMQEVDYYYPYLISKGYLESFVVTGSNGTLAKTKESQFSQIAYGIRPMIWATLEAYAINKDPKYASQTATLSSWFLGKNPAQIMIYNSQTGRCYDGIDSPGSVNKNSGAESTIEALWAFQLVEKYPEVVKLLGK